MPFTKSFLWKRNILNNIPFEAYSKIAYFAFLFGFEGAFTGPSPNSIRFIIKGLFKEDNFFINYY